uniref:Uncharacterized protein n=1 Tax=Heterorhabditis bacteriophora TaxID=37862 RepID=A0A1I7WLL6_HETBA
MESILHQMSQFNQEMARSCWARETQSVFRNSDFFGIRSARAAPICRTFVDFPISCKCRTTVEWSTFSSSATSRVGFAWVRFNNGSQLAVVNRQRTSATLLIFKALVSVTKS